jgi:hypothetical protein
MSNLRRCLVLIFALTVIPIFLPSAPAHAAFINICYITGDGLPTIRIEGDTDGGATFYVETASGDGRFLQMRPAGGHWEIHMLRSVPAGAAMDLDAAGYPTVIDD